ncbi:MAG: response regulator [Akkermansiaceae bacterium]
MNESTNANKILFVDDEEKTRKYFSRLYGHAFEILLAEDGRQGLEVFKENVDSIGVVVTDQKMPNMTGSELLTQVAEIKPSCVRILSTAYADIDAAIESVNQGGIYRYVTKPWEVSDLEVTLSRAMDLYEIEQDRGALKKQNRSSVESMASSDRVLAIATMAVIANDGLRNVGEALKAIVSLAESGEEAAEPVIEEGLDWRELYRRHLIFIQAVRRTFPGGGLAVAELDFSQKYSVSEVLAPLVDTDSFFEWLGAGASAASLWPGPKEQTQAAIRPLLDSLKSLMRDTGILLISDAQDGVEFLLPTRILSNKLKPLTISTAEEPAPEALAFTSALFRLAHKGAELSVSPDANRDMTRLRVGFNDQRASGSSSKGWDSLHGALSENDLFWSQK